MVKTCSVYLCQNRGDSESKTKEISFFRFPKDRRKRKAWIRAINRAEWVPNDACYVCSQHFVSGWHSEDSLDVDYAPTVFAYKKVKTDKNREDRAARRSVQKEFMEAEEQREDQERRKLVTSLDFHSSYCGATVGCETATGTTENCKEDYKRDQSMQCDTDPLLEENRALREELKKVKEELQLYKWSVDKIKNDDGMTKFYTGLPSFAVFMWLFNYLAAKSTDMVYWRGCAGTPSERRRTTSHVLEPVDQFLATLIRLKVGLYTKDVADRFGISVGTYSKYFTTWVCLLYEELKLMNKFPSRDIIKRNMPKCFMKYPNLRIILDCTEIFVQKSSSLINQSLTFSQYKHHNTLKFLIGITPSGIISFVSEAYGGRISDRQITIESGLLDILQDGDNVMADKGFTISDLLQKKGCTLNIPPFRGSAQQFSTEDVWKTQEIAELRIHVERSIGRVKRFHIFDGVLPLTLAGLASKMFQVCCWLTNLDVPLVAD